ncbi:protein kinase domain-containing protein [Kitasatospora paranensis]|uniref:non-specific serine/threonine protein kinase n=1 Tax=Kitasatospora paranensis TaxID=258053 RepID=A0ABW2G5I8_9ACTN
MADTDRSGEDADGQVPAGSPAGDEDGPESTAETELLPGPPVLHTPGRGTAALLGTVGEGRYRITGRLGRGGMAEVFAAQDVRLGRTVAVKLLRADLAEDDIARMRFTREAHAVAGLNHHSIVAVYDTGEELVGGESTPYIVMELVEGRTVRELLVDEEAPPVDQALIIIAGVLEALAYSHRNGIVHRDIKPANVIITTGGAVKVMDFGIARALTGAATTMTQTGMVMGTPQYLSPEQALGRTVDHRSDLYAAGCMLYELLALRPPFTGETPLSVVYQHVQDMPVPPSRANARVPVELDDLVIRSLAKNPDDRYQTADEFRAHVQHALRQMHGAAGAGYAAGAAAAAAAAASLAAAGQGPGTGGRPPYEGPPSGGTAPTEPLGSAAADSADPTTALPYQVTSPYRTPAQPYPAVAGQGYGGGHGPDDGDDDDRGRGPWGWVLGVLAVLVAAGVGIGLALSTAGGGHHPNPNLTQTSAPTDTGQPTSQATTPSATHSTGSVRPSETSSGEASPSGSPSGSASPSASPTTSPTTSPSPTAPSSPTASPPDTTPASPTAPTSAAATAAPPT